MAAYSEITSTADYIDITFADNQYLHQKARLRRTAFSVDLQVGNNIVEIHDGDKYEVSPGIGGKVVINGVDYTVLDDVYTQIRNLMLP